jgi:transposase, IS30 family
LYFICETAGAIKTITYDNGKEFVGHERIANKTEAADYFTTPYHSLGWWLNEYTNGLVRPYFPKKMDLRKVTREALQTTEKLRFF